MKKIEDYKGTKTAILCTTQQEWDEITALLGYKWSNDWWKTYKELSCINCEDNTYSRKGYYEEHKYTILSASDFLNNEEQQFIVDKWYKLDNWIVKFKKLKDKTNFDGYCINTTSGFTTDGYLSLNTYKPVLITDLTTIQQFLPSNHPDKIKEQPKQEENLVGRYIKVIKLRTENYWHSKLKVGDCLLITKDVDKRTLYVKYNNETPTDFSKSRLTDQKEDWELMPIGWTPDIKQELTLLEQAKLKYPIGTGIVSTLGSEGVVDRGNYIDDEDYIYANGGEFSIYDKKLDKWAEIIQKVSKTKDLSTLKDCYIELNSEDEYNQPELIIISPKKKSKQLLVLTNCNLVI